MAGEGLIAIIIIGALLGVAALALANHAPHTILPSINKCEEKEFNWTGTIEIPGVYTVHAEIINNTRLKVWVSSAAGPPAPPARPILPMNAANYIYIFNWTVDGIMEKNVTKTIPYDAITINGNLKPHKIQMKARVACNG